MHFTMERAGGVNPATKEAIKAFFVKGEDLPPNLKEIEAGDWAWGQSSYTPTAELYIGRVVLPDGTKGDMRVTVYCGGYYNHGGGFATLFMYDYTGSQHGHRVRFFEWASCQHRYSSKNIGRCLNRYTCEKCGHSYDVDSSD